MKILNILPNTATNKGGLEFSAAEIISSAGKQRADQQNIVAVLDTAPGDEKNKLARKLEENAALLRLDGTQDRSAQLKAIYAKEKPDLVVFWLPEITSRVATFLKSISVPLVVRASSTYDMSDMPHERKMAYKDCFDMVGQNGLVICNSEANRDWNHANFALPLEKQKVIMGGIEQPSDKEAAITRESLGIASDAYVVSNVTRVARKHGINYRKDPFGFVLMASYLSAKHPDSVFVMCGEGAQWSNSFVQALLRRANDITGGNLTPDRFKALGHIENADDIYRMSDIAVSTAQSESFGRTVVEAMAHGVASIVTDVGVMPQMNGDISHVVPARPFSYNDEAGYYGDPEQNRAWLQTVEKQFDALHERPAAKIAEDAHYLEQRVEEKYNIAGVAAQYTQLYDQMAPAQGAAAEVAPPARRR